MVTLVAAFALGAAVGPVESPASPTTKLELTLNTYRNTVVLYEPVALTYKVTNPTAEAIASNVRIHAIEFFITGPDGKSETYDGSRTLADGIQREVTHQPGSVVVSEGDLAWKGQDSVFPVTGVYDIRARLYAGDRPTPVYLESNRLRVEVRQPSRADLDAIASFASEVEFKRLLRDGATAYCEGRDGPACFEQLAQFVDRYRASAYAPTVTRNLADAVANGRVGVQAGYDVAVRLYKRYLQQWPDHPSAPGVMYCLAMVLDKAGRSGEAAEVMLEFEKKFPEQEAKARSLRANFKSGQMLAPKP